MMLLLLSSLSMNVFAKNYDLPEPLQDSDYHETSLQTAKLGQILFYDKLLSGNRISLVQLATTLILQHQMVLL